MAVSPLAQVDWNNLEGEDAHTVMDLLQRAFNERMVVSRINRDTDAQITQFYPFPDDNPTNSPDWGITGTVSTWHWTKHQIGNFLAIQRLVQNFADMTFINANINTVVNSIDNTADDLNLSESKVFAYIGITEWPDVMNPNATELKQWYDILCLLTHVFTCTSKFTQGAGVSGTKIKTEWSGIMQGGVYYSSIFSGSEVEFGGGSPWPPLSQLATDWPSVYGGPNTRNTTPSNIARSLFFDPRASLTQYDVAATRQYLTINNQDLTDTGYTRVPKEVKCWGQWDINVTGDATNTGTYLTDEDMVDLKLIEFPAVAERSAAEIAFYANEDAPSLPDIADDIGFNAARDVRFFDNWNDPTGATGFQYYTP